MAHSIYHNLQIKSSSEKIYEAISSPEHLINWWPLKCTGTPEIGKEYNFFFTSEYDWYGKVSRIEKNTAFHITMTKSDKDWDPTTFGFDLESQDNGVLVQFSHHRWVECNAHYKSTSYCWALLLHGLKDYLEAGIILPFEDRA